MNVSTERVSMCVNRIEYVSLHYRNGETKSYQVDKLGVLAYDLISETNFLFVVVNLKDENKPLIIYDLQEACCLLL